MIERSHGRIFLKFSSPSSNVSRASWAARGRVAIRPISVRVLLLNWTCGNGSSLRSSDESSCSWGDGTDKWHGCCSSREFGIGMRWDICGGRRWCWRYFRTRQTLEILGWSCPTLFTNTRTILSWKWTWVSFWNPSLVCTTDALLILLLC